MMCSHVNPRTRILLVTCVSKTTNSHVSFPLQHQPFGRSKESLCSMHSCVFLCPAVLHSLTHRVTQKDSSSRYFTSVLLGRPVTYLNSLEHQRGITCSYLVAVPELCCVPWKHCWSSSSLLFPDVFINEGQKSEFFH